MRHIKNVRGNGAPATIRMINNEVVVASNVHEYTETIEDVEIHGYEYDCDIYPKDQYIVLIAQQSAKIAELEDELAATKILLGVD